MFVRLILITALLAIPSPASAETAKQTPDSMALCPQIGTPAPAFSAITWDGIALTLDDITGPGGAVLVFSRSLDWCPYCQAQAIDLTSVAETLDTQGWPLSLISYDPPETLARFGDHNSVNYTLLSDSHSAMIDAFGLRNKDVPEGSRFDGIPHPAIIFIGSDGLIKGVQKEQDYKDRPPTEAIPQLVTLLNAQRPTTISEPN